MKHIRKIAAPVTEIEEIFCNKCGLSCRSPQGDFYGLIEAEVTGGYSSTHLGDGDVHKLSLCERCLKELIDTFHYGSFQGNYLAPDPNNQVEGFNPDQYWATTPLDENPEFQELVRTLDEGMEPGFDLELEDLGLSPAIEDILNNIEDDDLEDRISTLPIPRRIKKEDMN